LVQNDLLIFRLAATHPQRSAGSASLIKGAGQPKNGSVAVVLACAFIASGLGWTMLLIPIFILWAIEWIASGVFSVRNLAAYYRARQARRLGD